MKKVESLGTLLFQDGWAFMVVYTSIFIPCLIFHVPVVVTTYLFQLAHIPLLFLALNFLFNRIKNAPLSDSVFWIGLVGFFLAVGAYLEYPHDAWEFFRDIFEFQNVEYLHKSTIPHRSTYFWGWTWVNYLPIGWRRVAMTPFAAFWQILLAYQTYLLSLRVGFSKYWSKVQVIASILILGYCNANFYRLLGLSSTLINFVFVFRGLIILIDYVEFKKFDLKNYALLLILMGITHFQGILFLLIATTLLVGYRYQRENPTMFRKILKYVNILLGFGSALIVVKFLVDHQLLWEDTQRHFEHDGFFGLFDWFNSYSQMYGVPGFINLGLAYKFRKRYPALSILTIAPVIILLIPVTHYLLLLPLQNPEVDSRILGILPYSFFIVIGLKEWAENSMLPLLRNTYLKSAVVVLILIAISTPSKRPWFGRLENLLVQPDKVLNLEHLDPLAKWLKENRHPKILHCRLLTDQVTAFYLSTIFGWPPDVDRLNDFRDDPEKSQISKFHDAKYDVRYCGFLIARPEAVPPPPKSITNHRLHHWPSYVVDVAYFTTEDFQKKGVELLSDGWARIEVPPFYYLYEKQPTAP